MTHRARGLPIGRLAVMRVLDIILLTLISRPLVGQEPASLLRRLAEAVDGYRTGERLWVVAASVFPHEVLGVYSDSVLAKQVVDRAGTAYGVHGPFVAPPDPENRDLFLRINGVCGRHRPPTECLPKDTLRYRPIRIPLALAESITVSISVKGRPLPVTQTYGADEVDALFFTFSAFDKFVMPYFAHIYGVAYAARIRDQYRLQTGEIIR